MSDKPIGSCFYSDEKETAPIYGMIRTNEAPGDSPYYAFSGESYYPSGGARDLSGVYTSLEEAENSLVDERRKDEYLDWAHVMGSKGLCVSVLKTIG